MPKVNSNHSARLHAYHKIVQMSVSDTQNPVANAHQSMRVDKVGAKCQKGLGARAHLQKCPPGGGRHKCYGLLLHHQLADSQKYTYFKRSAGTLLSLFLKDVTVSVRLAPL